MCTRTRSGSDDGHVAGTRRRAYSYAIIEAMQRVELLPHQIGLIGGLRQEASDLITLAEPATPFAPEARKGRLYILAEPATDAPRGSHACQLALRTLRRAFYEDTTYSVTSALRAAVRAANKALYEYNVGLPAAKRVPVGVTCAVVKDGDLFVAQVQPAQAYVLSDGQVRALPAHPIWDAAHVSVAPFVRAGALGASLFIEPELYRCTLRPGDAALFCNEALAHLLDRPTVTGLLRAPDGATLIDDLQRFAEAAGLADVHALALTAHTPQSTAVREAAQPARRHPTSLATAFGGWLARWRGRDEPAPNPRAAADPMRTMPAQPTHSPTPPPRPAPLDVGESLNERYTQERARLQARAGEGTMPPSTYLGEGGYAGPTRRIDLGDGAALAAEARPYRPRYELRPLVDLTWSERMALPWRKLGMAIDEAQRARRIRRTTPAPARPILRGQGLSYRRTGPPFPWAMLLGILVVVGGLIIFGMSQTRVNDQQLALEYFAVAEERLAAVRSAGTETIALERLDAALQAIEEVRASPEVTRTNVALWTRYQELQREYERQLAVVQRVTFLDAPQLLAQHPSPTGRFASVVVPPARTNVTDTNQLEILRYIYAIDGDPQSARLYRIPRDGGTPQAYLSPNQTVGTSVVGPVRAAIWRIDQVVAVDEAPSGFGYYFRQGGSWNYSKLGSSEIWAVRDRIDVEEYDGNLYVWGAQPGELLKFNSGSYSDTPEFWLDPASVRDVDLTTVVDMAVDGGIYLLRANGSVVVLSRGQVVNELRPEGITPPIGVVTRFAVSGPPDAGSIFLLEPLNERIIQIDKVTGAVIQQIQVRSDGEIRLDDLAALFVDDSGARPVLYIANGGNLLRAELPAPPRPFREQE